MAAAAKGVQPATGSDADLLADPDVDGLHIAAEPPHAAWSSWWSVHVPLPPQWHDEDRLEVENFAGCIVAGRPPEVVSHADTRANMRTIDALHASAAPGAAVALAPGS